MKLLQIALKSRGYPLALHLWAFYNVSTMYLQGAVMWWYLEEWLRFWEDALFPRPKKVNRAHPSSGEKTGQ